MKNILLFTIALGLAIDISAQETDTNDSFLNAFNAEEAEWSYMYGWCESEWYLHKIVLSGDTIIDGTKWKFFTGDSRIEKGLVRVDNQKVLFKPHPEFDGPGIMFPDNYKGEPIVIYDFSLEVGDSVRTPNSIDKEIIKIDSITLNDGKKHRRFICKEEPYPYYHYYIEGLGSAESSPFSHLWMLTTCESPNELVCCHVNGQLLYKNPRFADCDGTPVGNEVIKTPDNLKISMGNNILQIAFDEDKPFDVAIYSLNGVLLKQQNGNLKEAVISIHSGKGIFVVRIICGKDIYTQKVYNK